MECDRQNFLSFWTSLDQFLSFYPPNNPKNQNFEKMKQGPGDIIILHMYTINDNHMMYRSWDIKRGEQNFFVILERFFAPRPPFSPTDNLKNKNFEKMKKKKKKKKAGDIIILHESTKNNDHMLYCSWDMVRDACNCYFSFWAFFCHFIPLAAQKIKIWKKRKKRKHSEILSFYTCLPKIMIRWYTVPEIWCATDRRTDGKSGI